MNSANEFDPDDIDPETRLVAKPGTIRAPKKIETAEVKELKDLVYRAHLMLSRKEYMTTATLCDDDQYLDLWLKNAVKILKENR